MAEDIRQIPHFRRIVLRDYGKLVLHRGDAQSLIIEGEEEVLEKVTSEVTDETLELRVGRKWLETIKRTLETSLAEQKITYHLTFTELEELDVPAAARVEGQGIEAERFILQFAGAGDISLTEIDVGLLEIEMPGAGRLDISGRAEEQRVVLSGAGSYLAPELESSRAVVELRGVGKARIHVKDRLHATLRGLGSVEYSGDPEVERSVSGLGSITKV